MIYRAFQFLSAEVRGLQAAAYVLAGAALLSSVLALGRDRLLANMFGAGPTLDLYYAAFRIPDLIFVGTGAMVSVYVLIPELARRTDKEQKKYFDTILAAFSLFACCISGIAAYAAPWILPRLFPQIVANGSLPELLFLTRVILLQPILLGLSNILAAVTQSRKRYTLYSLSPLLYNVGIIIGVAFFYKIFGVVGLAWGVVLGAALHVGIQIPSLVSDGFFAHAPRIYDVSAVVRTVAISLPRALALSMNQVAFLALISLAGLLAPGSIAIFVLAYNLQAVPLSMIGASYSVAAFPTLAAAHARRDFKTFLEHIATAARYVFFWSMPAMALIIALRAYVVRVILGSGNFDWTDTRLTAAVFALFSLSLVGQGLSLLLIRGYYAAGRTFVPFFVAATSAAATFVLGMLFIALLRIGYISFWVRSVMRLEDVPGVEILGLGAAYAFVSIIATVALCLHFEYRFRGFVARIWRSLLQSLFAASTTLFAAYVVLHIIGPIDVGSTALSVFIKGFAAGTIGLIVAIFSYWTVGSVELQETIFAIKGRFFPAEFKEPVGVPVAAASEENPVQT